MLLSVVKHTDKGLDKFEQIVCKLDLSIQLMYAGISTMQDQTLSRIGMKEVQNTQSFIMPRPSLTDSDGNLVPDY